jgi:glycosyltransferase involved in cell wall biosynthesis
MRILIDLQGAQATHRGRGIGRYSLSLAKALVRQKGPHEIQLLLNAHFPNSVDEIQQAFFGSLPASHVHVWKALEPIDDLRTENQERRRLAHQVRQAIIDAIAPDVVLLTSLFEGPGNSGLVSIDSDGPPVAVVLYDLIPLVHQDSYLTDPTVKDWYFGRLEELRKANMLLAISEYSRQEAISYLSWDADKIANISAACDDIFSPSIVTDRVDKIGKKNMAFISLFNVHGWC